MSYSLYFHVPFCKHRCAYCDFNTYAGQESLIPAYVDALCREIEFSAGSLSRLRARAGGEGDGKIHTLFFGGGTPSLLTPKQYEKILKTIRENFAVLFDAEISLEANPGTVSLDYLKDLRSLGFNRLSLGVQSSDPQELRQLERIHDFFDVIDAVTWARRAGFDNLNLDLIFGLPEQTLDRWSVTVKRAVDLAPEHLSLYALTVEHGTPFGRWSTRGLLPLPDADAAAEMYEWAGEYLEGHGYVQYEISNWALDDRRQTIDHAPKPALSGSEGSTVNGPVFACKHNLTYWRGNSYLGFGAGAHGYANGLRVSNILRIKPYIERFTNNESRIPDYDIPVTPATVNQTPISPHTAMQETMMTGLRLTREGVSAADFAARFGVQMTDVFAKEIAELTGLGLLEWILPPSPASGRWAGGEGTLRLTPRARLLGNQVFLRFVD